MSEKGKIIIRPKKNSKKMIYEIDLGGQKPMVCPIEIKDESLNGETCEVEREKGQIVKITVNEKVIYEKIKTNNSGEEDVLDSVDISMTKLPKDTKDIGFKNIDNFTLKLNKAVRVEFNGKQKKEEFKFFETDKGKVLYQIQPNFGDLKFEDFKTKMSTIKTSLETQGYKITPPISMQPDWRLIVGLGNESVYETSMTLHHIYGVPYIPGSAVKGVTRSYVIQQKLSSEEIKDRLDIIDKVLDIDSAEFKKIIDTKDKDKLKKLTRIKISEDTYECPSEDLINKIIEDNWEDLKQARAIFGNQNDQGKVIFFDAFPTSVPAIEPDIMNPHYGDYYSNKKASKGNPIHPADYLSPNPIFFLTVKDTEFDFYLGMKPKYRNEDILKEAEDWLKKALECHGIGAKTSVGYGYFKS